MRWGLMPKPQQSQQEVDEGYTHKLGAEVYAWICDNLARPNSRTQLHIDVVLQSYIRDVQRVAVWDNPETLYAGEDVNFREPRIITVPYHLVSSERGGIWAAWCRETNEIFVQYVSIHPDE